MKIPHHLRHMDINKIVAEIKDLIAGEHDVETVYTHLPEQCAALDTWMEAGGPLPDAWKAVEANIKRAAREKIAERFRERAESVRQFNQGHATTLHDLANQIERGDL